MIAYRRGLHNTLRLAGTASLRNRMPAVMGTFCIHWDIAQR